MTKQWYPHVTVATVVHRDNKFLMVKELSNNRLVINQPAGHLEENESIEEAAKRETLEETRWQVEITHFLGISQFIAPNKTTYIRHSFVATPLHEHKELELDPDISECCWMTRGELLTNEQNMRSPMVMNDIHRYEQGLYYDAKRIYKNVL